MKTYYLLALAIVAILFGSCTKDPENHMLAPDNLRSYLYADQKNDTIYFSTFDSWTASTSTDWLSLSAKSMELPYDYTKLYACEIPYVVGPNLTGKSRWTNIKISSYDYSYEFQCIQYPFLDIVKPVRKVITTNQEYTGLPDSVAFVDSAMYVAAIDTVRFIEFTGQVGLNFAPGYESTDWLHIQKNKDVKDDFGDSRLVEFLYDLDENVSTENRETKLILNSGKAQSYITVVQKGKVIDE